MDTDNLILRKEGTVARIVLSIAEIEGFCVGGAVVFALCCDLRICSGLKRTLQ